MLWVMRNFSKRVSGGDDNDDGDNFFDTHNRLSPSQRR